MQKLRRTIAVLLIPVLIVSSLSMSAFAKEDKQVASVFDYAASGALSLIIRGILTPIDALLPYGDNFYPLKTYQSDGFLSGTSSRLTHSTEQSRWRLGSASASLVPPDWQEHDYYIGGFLSMNNHFSNRVEEILDDMRVRVIALDDGTGRGTAVFATVDSIGLANREVRAIRALVRQMMPDTTFAGITVCATHCHSGIDTQGLWTDLLHKAPRNLLRGVLHIGRLDSGTDETYMAFLRDTVAAAITQAVQSMQTGTMTYAVKDIGDRYFQNRNRPSASALMTDLSRIVFTPDDSDAAPTMIVNIAAHPDVAGYPSDDTHNNGRGVSGDYVYYMGRTIADAGYNFMFFNGAIAGIYMSRGYTNNHMDGTMTRRVEQAERYGMTLGKIALSMTMTQSEIMSDPFLRDPSVEQAEREYVESLGAAYSLWYDGWESVSETTVPAWMNLTVREVEIFVNNPLIRLAGKLNLAAYDVLYSGLCCYVRTEIGYLELGGVVKAALVPGEMCQDLVVGGKSLTAEGSYRKQDFGHATITELFGDDTIIFGLANDAIGYIVPDNDFCMCGLYGHYHELICLGDRTASTIMQAFADLKASQS